MSEKQKPIATIRGVDFFSREQVLEAEIARLREALGRMQCTCLPHAKPHDGMCDRCMALEADDA